MDYHINLGTAGWGVWHSPDAGKSWTRHRKPFPLNTRIQSLAVLPGESRGVVAAGDTGVFASHDGGGSWARLGAEGGLPTVWSLAVDPNDPATMFAGTLPAAVYRSRDGGQRWQRLPLETTKECSIGEPFVTRVLVDPGDSRTIWAGVEIDGVYRSADGGESWEHMASGPSDPDVHDLAVAPGRVFVSTNREVLWSADRGATWSTVGIKTKWPLPYARGIAVKPDEPNVVFAGCGETTTGETGAVLRSSDGGQTWETLALPARPNATVWGLATHQADPSRVVAFTLFGEVYVTDDAGESWRKIAREFGEIRSAAWLPD